MAEQYQHQEREVRRTTGRTRSPWRVVSGVVNAIFGIIEIILAIAFVLRMFGANPNAAFVELIYGLAAPFYAPFSTVFGITETQAFGGAINWNMLLAIVVYALIAWGLTMLFNSFARSTTTVQRVEVQNGSGSGQLPPEKDEPPLR